MKIKERRFVHLKDPRVKDVLSKEGILYVNLDYKGFGKEVTKIDLDTYKDMLMEEIEDIENSKQGKVSTGVEKTNAEDDTSE